MHQVCVQLESVEESSSNTPATRKKVSCNANCSRQHSCSLTLDGGPTNGIYDLKGPIFVENVQLVQRKETFNNEDGRLVIQNGFSIVRFNLCSNRSRKEVTIQPSCFASS